VAGFDPGGAADAVFVEERMALVEVDFDVGEVGETEPGGAVADVQQAFVGEQEGAVAVNSS